MSSSRSRYGSDDESDYSHRFHAGNVGDVWKHCALVALLEAAASSGRRIAYLDTHAGEGSYSLAATGEWTEGIGRLWAPPGGSSCPDLLGRYLGLCRRLGAGEAARPLRYPGSPTVARALLGERARLCFWERDPEAFAALRATASDDPRARVVQGDGLVDLASEVAAAEESSDEVLVFIDPAWTQKPDWTSVPDVLARAVTSSRRAWFALWYPVKSLTRPNAMIERLAAAGVGAAIAELVTTPLDHRRNRLNGSGVLLVRAPDVVMSSLAAAAPALGQRCATHDGRWSFRAQAWSAR
jgi:23S rRNA (adenine2030-N6)-methyltransferase